MDDPGQAGGTESASPAVLGADKNVGLEGKADKIAVGLSAKANKLDLRESIANQVLKLFRYSLIVTLIFSGVILATDLMFIAFKVVSPAERLMTERVVMTLIGASVVQVGAALAAIVFAVFKEPPAPID